MVLITIGMCGYDDGNRSGVGHNSSSDGGVDGGDVIDRCTKQ